MQPDGFISCEDLHGKSRTVGKLTMIDVGKDGVNVKKLGKSVRLLKREKREE